MIIFTVVDMLTNCAKQFPDKIGIKDEKEGVPYSELLTRAEKIRDYLLAQRVKKGDRVGIFKDNSVNAVVAILGILSAGATFVNINTKLKARQVNDIIDDCGIANIISNYHKIAYFFDKTKRNDVTLIDIDKVLAADGKTDILAPRVIDRDLACLIYTSGSTGKPKGVMFTHNELVMLAKIIAETWGHQTDDNTLCVLPFSADYGLTLLYVSLLTGARLTILNSFFYNDVVNSLISEKITTFSGITPFWSMLYRENSLFPEKDFPLLRYLTIGGGYPPKDIMQKIMKKFESKTDIYMMYGLTESAWSTCLTPAKLKEKYGSIGKPIPNLDITLVNAEGNICKPQEEGQIVHRGGVIAKGYWNDEKKSEEVFRHSSVVPEYLRNVEKVVYSGDIAVMDEDGFIYFKARSDEQIKVLGYRVATEDVIDCIFETGLVNQACVLGIPTVEADQKIVACITPKNGTPELSKKLKDHLKKELPHYMIPAEFIVLKEMPLTQSHKINVSELKDLYLENKLASYS
jgi:acyl-CoA synthetase (AMP-forming)/AMP-acid ligase II